MTRRLPDLNQPDDALAPYREPTLDRTVVLDGAIFRAERQTVALPDGKDATRDLVYHGGGAAILACDGEDRVYLVAQYRKAVEAFLWEIPAGKLEKGEDPAEAAVRELKEETGLTAGTIEKLGVIIPTAGYCSERIHIYLATDLTPGATSPDEDEYLKNVRLPFRDALAAVRSGELQDAKTCYALLRLADRRAETAEEAPHGTNR